MGALKKQIIDKIDYKYSSIDEALIWFQEDYQVYSYPVFLEENSTWFYNDLIGNKRELQIYKDCRDKRDFAIKFNEYDFKNKKYKTIQMAYPLLDNGNFKGAFIWQSKINDTY